MFNQKLINIAALIMEQEQIMADLLEKRPVNYITHYMNRCVGLQKLKDEMTKEIDNS